MAREYEFFVLKQYPKERQFVILKEMEKGFFGTIGKMLGRRV
ncbi:MAG: hypothetical protein AABW86_03230 [Candidatus Micrarchaeota archaeon]